MTKKPLKSMHHNQRIVALEHELFMVPEPSRGRLACVLAELQDHVSLIEAQLTTLRERTRLRDGPDAERTGAPHERPVTPGVHRAKRQRAPHDERDC